jgi:hypothetical protein
VCKTVAKYVGEVYLLPPSSITLKINLSSSPWIVEQQGKETASSEKGILYFYCAIRDLAIRGDRALQAVEG